MAAPLSAAAWSKRLQAEGHPIRAQHAQRFFRTGPGEYGEGDRFLGITVPGLRFLAKEAKALSRETLERLLASPWHEIRLFALIILTNQARRLKDPAAQAELAFWLYDRRAAINNWDLVDTSIPVIFGGWVPTAAWKRKMDVLLRSKTLWDRRMAMLATFGWMRLGDLEPCFTYAERLLNDCEDLMHKAAGWMLREAGKRDVARLRMFLDVHAPVMPRTMLRYAIERLPEGERKGYLARKGGTS